MDLSKRRINPQNPARTIRGRKQRKSVILANAEKKAAVLAQRGTPIEAVATREDQPDRA